MLYQLHQGAQATTTATATRTGKKAIDLDWQNNNFARASRFLVHFFAVAAQLNRKSGLFHVLLRTGPQDKDFLFLFLNFDTVFRIQQFNIADTGNSLETHHSSFYYSVKIRRYQIEIGSNYQSYINIFSIPGLTCSVWQVPNRSMRSGSYKQTAFMTESSN